MSSDTYISVPNRSARLTCPSCRSTVMTVVETEANIMTHLMAVFLCVLGCCPCAILPYMMKSCKSTNHYCPFCDAYIGTYRG